MYENGSWDHIDPSAFIDDDGQAWLCWGNPQLYFLKLNEDMISYEGDVILADMTEEGFGAPKNRERGKKYKDSYVEGPWLTKRNGTYQLIYAAGGVPEHISYSTATSPTGPWKYAGEIMPLSDTNSFTNHSGVADYKGHSYFFYHTGKLPGGGGFARSIAVEGNPGCVRSREELLGSSWDDQFEGYDRTVDTHIKRLRARLGDAADIIETVRGIGYRCRS